MKQGRYKPKDNILEILINMENYLFHSEYYFDGVSVQTEMIDDKFVKKSLSNKINRILKSFLMLRSEIDYLKNCKQEEEDGEREDHNQQ